MMNFILHHLDFVASISELIGLYLVGSKSKIGFLFNMVCCISWILYVFISHSTYGILLVTIPALFINCRNYFKWKNEENS